jgi:hypothetical protein
MEALNKRDLADILESLKYTKLRYEEYQGYPSQEFKQQRIDGVVRLMAKVQKILKET